jgi:hypothetical protein
LTDVVPPGLAYLPGTLVATSGVPNPSGAPRLTWFGQLDATDGVTISYAVTVTANAAATIVTTAEVAASGHVPQTTSAILLANPLAAYLPLLLRNQP